jgi:hypothetical protein
MIYTENCTADFDYCIEEDDKKRRPLIIILVAGHAVKSF